MTSSNDLSADIVIVGSGVAGSSIAKELASTGASVIVLEAGPRIDRQHILDNCRNTVNKNKYDEPYPPSPWSMHPPDQSTPNAYLHTTGPMHRPISKAISVFLAAQHGIGQPAHGVICPLILNYGHAMG